MKTNECQLVVKEENKEAKSVEDMYEDNDLSTCSIFVGGYINFGIYDFEEGIGRKTIQEPKLMTYEERLASEKSVYLETAKLLGINKEKEVLDVACGGGLGTMLIYESFLPKRIVGVDFPNQVKRCERNLAKTSNNTTKANVSFHAGSATELPFQENTFDGITCVGGLIYFSDFSRFFEESFRVLKKDGALAIASYLGLSDKSNDRLKQLIHPIGEGFEYAHSKDLIDLKLREAGFKVEFRSIGAKVFEGFNKWISQTEYKGTWSDNWLKSYNDGLIDYYLILATK